MAGWHLTVFLIVFAAIEDDVMHIPFGMGQNLPDNDLNATNGTLAIVGPVAASDPTGTSDSTQMPPSSSAPAFPSDNSTVPSLGPLERLGQLAKSLSPFPLNHSAPAPPTGPAMNGTNTSPFADGIATNATGAFTPLNNTMAPLNIPPTASTNAPVVPIAAAPAGQDAAGSDQVGGSPVPMNTTTTTMSTPIPPPLPASAAGMGWSSSMLVAGILMLFVSLMA